VLLSVGRDCAFANAELRAASTIHNDMLHTVMRAPMAFFDTTPIGRIIARFSKDQNTLDMQVRKSTVDLSSLRDEISEMKSPR
jgi:ABC-type multidrug transport system fused ATPase/permease subunit